MATFNVFSGQGAQVTKAIFDYARQEGVAAGVDIANAVVSAVHSYWANLAQSTHGWGSRYARALVMKPATQGTAAEVYLDDDNPDAMFGYMMENGVNSWSIRDALMQSSHAQVSQRTGLKYMRIPFRYRVPGAQKATSGFAGVMDKDIYERVLSGETIDAATATGMGQPNMAGLKRYGAGGHSQYLTFRTVTEKSPGWKYPRQPKRPVFSKVLDYVEKAIEIAIAAYMERLERNLKK